MTQQEKPWKSTLKSKDFKARWKQDKEHAPSLVLLKGMEKRLDTWDGVVCRSLVVLKIFRFLPPKEWTERQHRINRGWLKLRGSPIMWYYKHKINSYPGKKSIRKLCNYNMVWVVVLRGLKSNGGSIIWWHKMVQKDS